MPNRLWYSLLATCLLTSPLSAQNAVPALTEESAVQLALKNQPLMRVAQADVEIAKAQVDQAKSDANLQMSGNAMAVSSTMSSVLAAPGVPQSLMQSQDRNSVGINGMVMLPLDVSRRIQSAVRSARYMVSASQQDLQQTRIQVAYMARMRFAEWQQALALMAVANESLIAQTQNTQVTQQLFDVGKVPQFDLLRMKAALTSAQQQVANSQAEVTSARAQLAQALGIAVDDIPNTPTETPVPAPPTDAVATALKLRPDYAAAQEIIKAAEATISERKAQYKPQIYAIGMADAFSPSNMGKSDGITVGIIAGVPIIDGGSRKAKINEAEQMLLKARANRDVIELQIRADAAKAEAYNTSAKQRIDTAKAQLEAAERAYLTAQARYSGGKSTIAELLEVQQALTEARQSLVIAQAQYHSTLAELYLAIGMDGVNE